MARRSRVVGCRICSHPPRACSAAHSCKCALLFRPPNHHVRGGRCCLFRQHMTTQHSISIPTAPNFLTSLLGASLIASGSARGGSCTLNCCWFVCIVSHFFMRGSSSR
ncbi:unnamed protein product, partial [Ectocarpus sp. 12 AP-2014]